MLALLALAVVYGPGLGNGLVFDDSALTDDRVIGTYGSLFQLQPRLLSYGSFVWLQNLFSENWAVQRAFNVALHAATCMVLFFLLRELLALVPVGDDRITMIRHPHGRRRPLSPPPSSHCIQSPFMAWRT
ncbi:MAG: hypothetical protein IPG98_00055 [Burkholderiales bacterium]|nr:hypothetical protein [Burkholderiales bacterium]